MGVTRFGNLKVQKALNRWGNYVISDVKRIVVETATIIRNEAKARVPVDSGDLRDSIEMEILNDGLTAIVHVGVFYAIFVEFGTGIYAVKGNGRKTPWSYYSNKLDQWVTTQGMHAQPFWFPAIDIAKKYFYSEMKKLGR